MRLIIGEIKYDDKLTDEDGVYIQAALLFTSCAGERRLRIINLALSCGSSMADMYRNCKSILIQLIQECLVKLNFVINVCLHINFV